MKVLETYLNKIGKTIVPVARDGWCILSSMLEVLKQKSNPTTLDELIVYLRREMSREEYKDFSVGYDVLASLDRFLDDPQKQYVAQSVDLVLPALLKALNANGTVSIMTSDRNLD